MAHNINNGLVVRTTDVKVSEKICFSSLLLSDRVQRGLKEAQFQRPSPIQLKAIPIGRCGLDLIVQAKSGTGKTCVFAVVALESLVLENPVTQVLVLAPTREIAVQIQNVIKLIGAHMTGLYCQVFIGGLKVKDDKVKLIKCHIAVGSPGRIKQLIESKLLKTDTIRLFVLDEADKLVESEFQKQINWIYSALPQNKQMLALSATYPEALAEHLTNYMRNPTFVRLNSDDPALLGISQYYDIVDKCEHTHDTVKLKVKSLIELLSSVTFSQCIIFFNQQILADELSQTLNDRGWPTTTISGSHSQKERLNAMAKLKTIQCRVLITTDLTARGIDAEHVNLIINLDIPRDHETYFHRIGRAGRYGTYGAAVTYVSNGSEENQLYRIKLARKLTINILPDPLPENLLQINKIQFGNVDSLVCVTKGARPVNVKMYPTTLTQTDDPVAKPEKLIDKTSVDTDMDKELNLIGIKDLIPSLNVYRLQKKIDPRTYQEIVEDFRLYMESPDDFSEIRNFIEFHNIPLKPSDDELVENGVKGSPAIDNCPTNEVTEVEISMAPISINTVENNSLSAEVQLEQSKIKSDLNISKLTEDVITATHSNSNTPEESSYSSTVNRSSQFKRKSRRKFPMYRTPEYAYSSYIPPHSHPGCPTCYYFPCSTCTCMYCCHTMNTIVCPYCGNMEKAPRTVHIQSCSVCYYNNRDYAGTTTHYYRPTQSHWGKYPAYCNCSRPCLSSVSNLPKYIRAFRAYVKQQ